MKILLDTNFVLTCVKEGIDIETLSNEIIDEEIEWILPQQVLNELGNLKDKKEHKKKDKDAAKLTFEVLKTLNPKIVDIGKNPNIDLAIINYIMDKEITLATLDKELKNKMKNKKILTIKGKNYLTLI